MTILPSELWVLIFYWATYNPLRLSKVLDTPLPFETFDEEEVENQCRKALTVKRILSLVCSDWRFLSIQFMFEDIQVRYGSAALANILESGYKSINSRDALGSYVHRAVFYMERNETNIDSSKNDESFGRCARSILANCPNVRLLARRRESFAQSHALNSSLRRDENSTEYEPVNISTITRLDWVSERDDVEPGAPVATFIQGLTSLKFLSIGGTASFWTTKGNKRTANADLYPNVQMLCIRADLRINDSIVNSEAVLHLPALDHLVLQRPLYGEECAIFSNLEKIHTLELGRHVAFSLTCTLEQWLDKCHNLDAVYYHVFFARPIPCNDADHASTYPEVKVVGLHAAPNRNLQKWETWWMIAQHFAGLCSLGSRFPGLEKIELYGNEWDKLVHDTRFARIQRLVRSRHITLVLSWPGATTVLSKTNKDDPE